MIPVWPVLGDPSDVGDLVRGRWPQVGEALVSSSKLRSLGLAEPVGYLASIDGLTQYPIVGAFESKSPLEDLEQVRSWLLKLAPQVASFASSSMT